jgi:DNA-binding response OmpR family regulator
MKIRKVLLILDDAELKRLCGDLLRKHEGIEIIEAHDVDKGFQVTQTKKPDIILIDKNMPLLNGENFSRMVKKNYPTRHIPIILFTDTVFTPGELNIMFLEEDEVILKPVSAWELINRIEDYIGTLVEKI